MKSILVTGGAGFIGSNFLPYFVAKYPDYFVINLDKLTYAGNLQNLSELHGHNRYKFIQGDICNAGLVQHIFSEYDVHGVIHFAAESHVDNSISGPETFILTNVNGTFTLLDAARKHWMSGPNKVKEGYETSRFHHVSTDEVYGSLGDTGYFTERTPYAPNSPYSASKASSDMIVRSYVKTYGFNAVITNCSNNYGPKQHDEKLIPVVIRKALNQQSIPIYGDGKNVRDWLYVLDHCVGIDSVFHKGRIGETYNIGSDNEVNNLEIVGTICNILDQIKPLPHVSYKSFITFVQDRPGHDKRYAIDASKMLNEMNWSAQTPFETGLKHTIEWYIRKYNLTTPSTETASKTTATPPTSTTPPTSAYTPPITESTTYTNTYTSTELPQVDSISAKIAAYEGKKDLEAAQNLLVQVKAEQIMAEKRRDGFSSELRELDEKGKLIVQKAQKGDIDWGKANEIATTILRQQEAVKQKIANETKIAAEMQLQTQKVEDLIRRLRLVQIEKNAASKMPDSSDTLSMMERMKSKIDENEALSDLYKQDADKAAKDAKTDNQVNQILGNDQYKSELERLKAQLGIKKSDS
ncbi:MAG: dTDP-glucose 4,6-dehydratase [Cytophagales bacterium]|nr:MAG: dTDP-glucose 4,6-dehydratase [Cytophagales bacterium]TAF61374.1 MAG: dTDP-glucose 4,6-dehydratase [Cytophagales bacterium]